MSRDQLYGRPLTRGRAKKSEENYTDDDLVIIEEFNKLVDKVPSQIIKNQIFHIKNLFQSNTTNKQQDLDYIKVEFEKLKPKLESTNYELSDIKTKIENLETDKQKIIQESEEQITTLTHENKNLKVTIDSLQQQSKYQKLLLEEKEETLKKQQQELIGQEFLIDSLKNTVQNLSQKQNPINYYHTTRYNSSFDVSFLGNTSSSLNDLSNLQSEIDSSNKKRLSNDNQINTTQPKIDTCTEKKCTDNEPNKIDSENTNNTMDNIDTSIQYLTPTIEIINNKPLQNELESEEIINKSKKTKANTVNNENKNKNIDEIALQMPKKQKPAAIKKSTLILGDEHVRDMNKYFKKMDTGKNDNYLVHCYPGKYITDLKLDQNIKIDQCECLILMGGSNDVFSNKFSNIHKHLIDFIRESCTRTKIILISIPYRYDKPSANTHIHRLNKKIKDLVNIFKNTVFLEINKRLKRSSYGYDKISINPQGKQKICEAIQKIISNPKIFENKNNVNKQEQTVQNQTSPLQQISSNTRLNIQSQYAIQNPSINKSRNQRQKPRSPRTTQYRRNMPPQFDPRQSKQANPPTARNKSPPPRFRRPQQTSQQRQTTNSNHSTSHQFSSSLQPTVQQETLLKSTLQQSGPPPLPSPHYHQFPSRFQPTLEQQAMLQQPTSQRIGPATLSSPLHQQSPSRCQPMLQQPTPQQIGPKTLSSPLPEQSSTRCQPTLHQQTMLEQPTPQLIGPTLLSAQNQTLPYQVQQSSHQRDYINPINHQQFFVQQKTWLQNQAQQLLELHRLYCTNLQILNCQPIMKSTAPSLTPIHPNAANITPTSHFHTPSSTTTPPWRSYPPIPDNGHIFGFPRQS